MTLYEIDSRMDSLIDPETGELKDIQAYNDLNMARDEKLENTALWVKDLLAEAKALKEEEQKLAGRRRAAENKAESLKGYLKNALNGQTFSTSRCDIRYRKSTAVEVSNEYRFMSWCAQNNRDDLLNYSEPTISKKAIGESLKSGEALPFCELREKQNIQIK